VLISGAVGMINRVVNSEVTAGGSCEGVIVTIKVSGSARMNSMGARMKCAIVRSHEEWRRGGAEEVGTAVAVTTRMLTDRGISVAVVGDVVSADVATSVSVVVLSVLVIVLPLPLEADDALLEVGLAEELFASDSLSSVADAVAAAVPDEILAVFVRTRVKPGTGYPL